MQKHISGENMKVKMKQFEAWCGEDTERWNKKASWDYYCIAKDLWIAGFKKAREEAVLQFTNNTWDFELSYLTMLGENPIDVDLFSNQIGTKKENPVEDFKTLIRSEYNTDDLRVTVDEDGKISFQGTARTKK